MFRNTALSIIAILMILGGVLFVASCGSSNSTMTPNIGTVNVMLSDPATCSGPQGTISHIFVTITDVKIHASSSAGPNDAGWIDLTPNLSQNPMQVDLLGVANNQCFLATLGSTTEIQPGTFQQIRIFLAANNATVSGNKCGGTANCVMVNNSATPEPLMLSSEAQTGIKIASGQIAGGQFTVAAGQTKDLDIDFNACESIVAEGNGQFLMKPVLHAGEVALTSTSINGKVVSSATNAPVSGGTTVVALEQKDSVTGVDRVIMETLADSTGAFVFCPVPAGMYDVVVDAVDGSQVAYGATVITGVQPGNSLGTVPITPQGGVNQAAGSITGQVTTSTGSAAIAVNISVSALQSIMVNGSPLLVTIPLASQSATSVNLTTGTTGCPANTDCANYTLTVAAANPSVGPFSTSGTQTPAPPSGGAADYTVDAEAFVTGGGTTPDCTKPDMQTSLNSLSATLAVTAGVSVTAQTLAFSSCN
jgi:hypothetical protein